MDAEGELALPSRGRSIDARRRRALFEVHNPGGVIPLALDDPAIVTLEAIARGDAVAPAGENELGRLLVEAASLSPELTAVFTDTGRHLTWANDAFRDQLQVPAWASPPLIELLDDSSKGKFVVKVLPSLLNQGWWQGRMVMEGPDVRPMPVLATIVSPTADPGRNSRIVLTAQAAPAPTAIRSAEGDQAHFAALVEHVSDLICVIEPGGIIRYASPAAATMLGQAPGALAGSNLLSLLHPEDEVDSVGALVGVDVDDGSGTPTTLRLRAADGGWRSIEAVISDLTDNPAIRGYVLNARDITERARAYEMLSRLAYTDPDTGLPNQLRLLDRVTNLLEDTSRSRPITLAIIDLDDFRDVNETHGLRVGDALLAELGRRLVEGAGRDALVGRLRSVEFAVVLPDVSDPAVAERAADALRVLIARPFEHRGHTTRVTASIGVALASAGDQADELLRQASHAAGHAKRSGGNRVTLWGEEAARRESRRRVVERRLQRVLDDGGLRVDYQPMLALATGELAGAEALLRIREGEDDVLNPAELVEAAESSGLMNQLGSQVLQATCEQLSQWDAQLRTRAPDHVSVNVSPRQLVDPGLATQVVAALGFSAIEPRRLWLEITESTLVGQHEVFVERIGFLRDLGVKVGLDEFGAGYSTLNSLKRFPLDFVKIDRSMVAGLGMDQRDTAIVRATIELAHTLGLAVVAVGVETDEQRELLTTLGCDHAQGYLFSPAVTPDELLTRLDKPSSS